MKTNLSDIEPCEVFFENVPFYQEVEKVAPSHVLEDLSDMKSKLNQSHP